MDREREKVAWHLYVPVQGIIVDTENGRNMVSMCVDAMCVDAMYFLQTWTGGGAWYLCVAIHFQRHGEGEGHGST